MLKPFALIPNGYVLLVRRGVYRTSRLFTHDALDNTVFAKYGGGYIKLSGLLDKATSCKDLHWVSYSAGVPIEASRLGWLKLAPVSDEGPSTVPVKTKQAAAAALLRR